MYSEFRDHVRNTNINVQGVKVAEETKRCNKTQNKIPRHETIQIHSI